MLDSRTRLRGKRHRVNTYGARVLPAEPFEIKRICVLLENHAMTLARPERPHVLDGARRIG